MRAASPPSSSQPQTKDFVFTSTTHYTTLISATNRCPPFLSHQGMDLMLYSVAPRRKFSISWPQQATFFIARAQILQRPRWLYKLLLRLSTAEDVCPGLGSYGWSHAMERLWFLLFDPTRTLALHVAHLRPGVLPASASGNVTSELIRTLCGPLASATYSLKRYWTAPGTGVHAGVG